MAASKLIQMPVSRPDYILSSAVLKGQRLVTYVQLKYRWKVHLCYGQDEIIVPVHVSLTVNPVHVIAKFDSGEVFVFYGDVI